MSKHVSNFINISIKIWTELLYRARYYTYYIKLKWRYSALLTWKISNLKKKKKSDQLCLYVFIHNWSILLTPFWLIQSNKGSKVQSWPHVNFHEHFLFVVLTIMLWFLFSRPSVQFSVTSINRSRREVGLNWISCSDKKAYSQFSWIVQEQPYRHHSAWKIRTTGIAIKSGSIFRWFKISFRIPPFGDSLFTNNPWLN